MPADIIILQKCTKNHDHMLYCSCDMARDRCNCYFSFWAIFCSFNPLTAQKIKRKKKKKNPVRYHHFTHVYQELRSDDACFLRYDAQQTDGRTDRWMDREMDKRSDIQRWVPHLKIGHIISLRKSYNEKLHFYHLIVS